MDIAQKFWACAGTVTIMEWWMDGRHWAKVRMTPFDACMFPEGYDWSGKVTVADANARPEWVKWSR